MTNKDQKPVSRITNGKGLRKQAEKRWNLKNLMALKYKRRMIFQAEITARTKVSVLTIYTQINKYNTFKGKKQFL